MAGSKEVAIDTKKRKVGEMSGGCAMVVNPRQKVRRITHSELDR